MVDSEFKLSWGDVITEIVIKKDLDAYEFNDCWEEGYDWEDLDKYVIENYYDEVLDWGEIESNRLKLNMNREDLEKDLEIYLSSVYPTITKENYMSILKEELKGGVMP